MDNNNVIEKIKSGEVKMRPKAAFVLKSILLVALSLLLFFLLLFLVSFILLFINPAGFLLFFPHFPWLLLFVAVIFIVLLEYLIKRYAVAYRRPVLYSLSAIVFLVFALSIIMNSIRFHEMMEERNIPGVYRFYDNFHRPRMEMECPGCIDEIKIRYRL